MLIKVLVSMSGPSETYTGGQVYEVADERAGRLIGRGFAVALATPAGVVAAEAVETATIAEPIETTSKRGRRK